MRITLLCNDTQGGVQPYAALAAGLTRAGHKVNAVAPSYLSHLFTQVGVPVSPLSGTSAADLGNATAVAEQGTVAAIRFVAGHRPPQMALWPNDVLQACTGSGLIIGWIGGMVIGLAVAEKLKVPFQVAHLQPIGLCSRNFPGVLLSWVPGWGKGALFPLSQRLSDAAVWMPFRRAMAESRAQLGLSGPPIAPLLSPLFGFSPLIVDPGQRGVATGYWQAPAPQDWTPPLGLEAFLAGDKPVVSIGFGSMGTADAAGLSRLLGTALRQVGARAVILSGAAGLEPGTADSDQFHLPAAPHDWLFGRVAAIVHHGGAGTTGAALTAGVPAVIVPFAVDQPFWGRRAASLGVSPTPIPRKALTADRLARALQMCLTDQAMRQRAADLGRHLQAEDGVARTVGLINDLRG